MSDGSLHLSDEELAQQCQEGSLAAFEELVSRYEGRIYAFVTHSTRNATAGAEITQETFVRAFQAIAQFDARRTFSTWLFAIARRKCLDFFRRGWRVVEPEPAFEPADENDPGELLAQREERERLWALARRSLPEPQFQALWLRYAEDMEVAAIARVLGLTQTYVKVLLFRARENLGRRINQGRAAEGALRAVDPARKPELTVKTVLLRMITNVL